MTDTRDLDENTLVETDAEGRRVTMTVEHAGERADLETRRAPRTSQRMRLLRSYLDRVGCVRLSAMLYEMKRGTVRPQDRVDAEAIRERFGLEDEA